MLDRLIRLSKAEKAMVAFIAIKTSVLVWMTPAFGICMMLFWLALIYRIPRNEMKKFLGHLPQKHML